MPRHEMSLTTRVVATNGVLFATGTALLAFSPATVSSRPVISELVVLSVGMAVIIAGNALLLRGSLRPLDRLVAELNSSRDGEALVGVPPAGIARTLALAVNDLLARIEGAQRASNAAALAAQESERARVAQELHDGLGQSLTAIMLEVSRDPGDQAAAVRESLRGCLDEVRRVAGQLRPHVLEDLGLRSALAALSSDLFAHLPTHVVRGVVPGLPELDDATELVVFRVAQEALTNVARHAHADTVTLTLTTRGDHVVLSVVDDGTGIPAGARGTGLSGMAERAALVGGTLEVARRDGGGTSVTLEVPVLAKQRQS